MAKIVRAVYTDRGWEMQYAPFPEKGGAGMTRAKELLADASAGLRQAAEILKIIAAAVDDVRDEIQ